MSYALKQAVYEALSGNAALSALVGGRIYSSLPQTVAMYPMVTFRVVSEVEEDADGKAYFERSLFEVKVWGGDADEDEIGDAVRAAMRDLKAVQVRGLNTSDYAENQVLTPVKILDFRVLHRL